MRIAFRSSFVHLEASLCQGKVRPHTSCCLVARIPFSSPVHNHCRNEKKETKREKGEKKKTGKMKKKRNKGKHRKKKKEEKGEKGKRGQRGKEKKEKKSGKTRRGTRKKKESKKKKRETKGKLWQPPLPRHLVTLGLKSVAWEEAHKPPYGLLTLALLPQRGKRCPWATPLARTHNPGFCKEGGFWGEEAQGTIREREPGKTNKWVGYNSGGTMPDALSPRRTF